MQFKKYILDEFKPLIKTLIFIGLCLIISCNNERSKRLKLLTLQETMDEVFADKLGTIMQPIHTPENINALSLPEYVRYTYQLCDNKPIWIRHGKLTENVQDFLKELEDIRWDGFDPEQYNLKTLRQLASLFQTKGDSLALAITLDTCLTHSYLDIAYDLLMGELDPEVADPIWYHINDTTWDAPQLLSSPNTKYTSLNHYRSAIPTYTLISNEYKRYYQLINDTQLNHLITNIDSSAKRMAKLPDSETIATATSIIKKEIPWIIKTKYTTVQDTISEEKQLIYGYQYYFGLKQTGKLDKNTLQALAIPPDSIIKKLSANMERIRWMQQDFGNFYILVDIPLMEFLLRKDGKDLMKMRVVVGSPKRPTPSLFAMMSNIVINPPWGVPPTILKNDVLPGIEKSGKRYLAKKGLKAYDKNGKIVNATTINARNYRRYTFRQDPGDGNSLGFVKFNLRNPFDIYLHDTPHRDDFVKYYRALSSGCVRLQKPQELAVYILAELEKKPFTQEILSKKILTHITESVGLKTKIPVHITYLTSFEDSTGNHLRMLNDVYKHDSLLINLMK